MGRKYAFHSGQDEIYFITCTVIRWIDIFTHDSYRQIVLDSISYCQQHKGLDVYAWVIMSNHIHMIVGKHGDVPLGKIIGSFKSFIAKRVRDELNTTSGEAGRIGCYICLSGRVPTTRTTRSFNSGSKTAAIRCYWKHNTLPAALAMEQRG